MAQPSSNAMTARSEPCVANPDVQDNRNVIDYYKYWTTEAIKADLDLKRHNFSVLVGNEINDFNLSGVIRNCNAFLAKEVIIYGRKAYDRRGTVGTHLYENLKHVRFTDELSFPPDTLVLGFDNIDNAKPLESHTWDYSRHAVMVFGQENIGLTEALRDLCHDLLYIRQYGSVRSLNVACASGIIMYDYCKGLAP